MTVRQRVMRYLLGLFIGSAIVFFMFPNYDWLGWTPNKRIMEQVRESKLEINAQGQCMIACTHITQEEIQAIRDHGRVDFSKSDAQSTPKKYHIQYGEQAIEVLLTDSLATIYHILVPGSTCNCPTP